MFDCRFAKSILLDKNEDDTYHMTIKGDIYNLDPEAEIDFSRVKIINFDIEALATTGTICKIKII
mgnify:CR=1 FL=1